MSDRHQILYLTERVTIHDRRFIAESIAAGGDVHLFSMNPREDVRAPGPDDPRLSRVTGASPSRSDLRRVCSKLGSDLIQAGPLTTAAFVAAEAGLRPLLSVSWAMDVLLQAREQAHARERVSSAVAASDVIIVDSLTVEDSLRNDFTYAGPIVRFAWGTDIEMFRPASGVRRSPQEASTIVSTRAWEPLYRVRLLVDAFALAYRLEPRLRLVLVNDGSQRPAIRRRIQSLGIRDVVTILGRMSEPELAGVLRDGDIYVSAATVDGTSVSLLQALATGMPTICTDNPANREWLTDGPGSRLIGSDNPRDWADAMLETARLGRSDRNQVRTAARSLALRRGNWDVNRRGLIAAQQLTLGESSVELS